MSLGDVLRRRRKEKRMTQDQVCAKVGISKPYLSNIETGRAKNPPTDGVIRRLEKALGFKTNELMRLAHRAITPNDVQKDLEILEAERDKLRNIVKQFLAKGPRKGSGGVDLDEAAREATKTGNVSSVAAGPAVPVINKVNAGYPAHFTDLDYPAGVAEEYIRCPDLHDPQAFAARVVGDSMEPVYFEGDIVVFAPNTPARSGDDCFVRFAEEGGTTFKRFYEDPEEKLRLQPLNSKYPSLSYPREQITGLWPAAYRIQKVRGS
jgi:phage repressor protein C with HTH and peptisase S24 domain